MEDNSPVIAVQREDDMWVWTISSEDLLKHRMQIVQKSNQSHATYEAALADAEATLGAIMLS